MVCYENCYIIILIYIVSENDISSQNFQKRTGSAAAAVVVVVLVLHVHGQLT